MKINILSTVLLSGSLALAGCNDYLDMTPTDRVSDKMLWSTVGNAELAINDFYHSVGWLGQYEDGQCVAGMTDALTDAFKYSGYNFNAYMRIPSEIAYGGPTGTPTANYVAAYLGNWSTAYSNIRKVNEAIANLNKYGTFDKATFNRLSGELRFFRGFMYFDLVKRYKEVILYDEDLTKIQRNSPLSTEEKGWDMVQADLDFAAHNLPVNNNGRITKGAAFAMQSRAMLYAGRWDVAKAAADSVVNIGIYGLTDEYADSWKGNNKEAILCYDYGVNGPSHTFDNMYSPGGDPENVQKGGYGMPTQEMVESYELADGSGFPDWSVWHTTTGTSEQPPYNRLEPRFKASVLYNGANWKGRGIETFVSGRDGFATWKVDVATEGRSITGYYLRKMIDETHDFAVRTPSTQAWVAIRYAEVLLNRAEANYRLGDAAAALADVNAVRMRPGVNLPAKSGLTGDALFAAIRQERKVELAFEGQLYWDMRRWKLAHTAYTGIRLHGLKIEEVGDHYKYIYVEVDDQDRQFPQKMYRFPLPQDELDNNSAVKQYTEWQ